MTAAPATSSDHMRALETRMSRADDLRGAHDRDLDALQVALRVHPPAWKRDLYRQVADAVMLVAPDWGEPERHLFEQVAGLLFERANTS